MNFERVHKLVLFALVAVGLRDDDSGSTEVSGIARLAGGAPVPLGRKTFLLDLLNLSPDARRGGRRASGSRYRRRCLAALRSRSASVRGCVHRQKN